MNVICWNVAGFNAKKMIDVCDFFKEAELICILETWLDKKGASNVLNLEGYKMQCVIEPCRRSSRGRGSGGITLLVKNDVIDYCTVITPPCLNSNVLWVGVKNDFNDYVIGFVYNPPQSSNFHIPNFYAQLNTAMNWITLHGWSESTTLLLGDFNSRIGSYSEDFISNCGHFQPDLYTANDSIIESRRSMDTTVDAMGKNLLKFCSNNELLIFNGRSFGDKGDFTFLSKLGKSVVDYGIGPAHEIDDYLATFKLADRVESDHLPLCLSIKWNVVEDQGDMITHVNQEPEEEASFSIPAQVKWSNFVHDSYLVKIKYYSVFLASLMVYLVGDSSKLEFVVNMFNEILMLVCRGLGLVVKNRGAISYSGIKNNDCHRLKKQVILALKKFRRSRSNDDLSVYLDLKEEYKSATRKGRKINVKSKKQS